MILPISLLISVLLLYLVVRYLMRIFEAGLEKIEERNE